MGHEEKVSYDYIDSLLSLLCCWVCACVLSVISNMPSTIPLVFVVWMDDMDVSRDKESLDRSVRRWIIISSLSHTSALPNMITLSSANWNRQKCSNQKREIFFFDMNKKKRTTGGGLFDDDVAMRMVCCVLITLLQNLERKTKKEERSLIKITSPPQYVQCAL